MAGCVEYLAGFPCTIVDCDACGCRTSSNLSPVHAGLHAVPAISYYATYRAMFDQCRQMFAREDLDGLERALRKQAKYAFVLDRLAALSPEINILEWGCSRGYLAAASLLAGRRVLAVDVASEPIAAAREAFGDHFVTDDSPRIESTAPYDAIYHVGLIGCVVDPIGFTERLLSLLKPGGTLFFNAPNREAMHQRGQLWLDSAPPPELVTLFPGNFWRARTMPGVTVEVTVTTVSDAESTVKTLQRWLGPRWHAPAPQPADSGSAYRWTQPRSSAWHLIDAVAAKASSITGVRLGDWPEEFGLYVVMTKS